MAIFFRTFIDADVAFEKIETSLSETPAFDGYFSVHGGHTFSRPNDMGAEEFKQEVVDALRSIWEKAQFWAVYLCEDQQNGLTLNEITAAAIQLGSNYPGAVVITLSILGRVDSDSDLELIFVCFVQDSERRNFRARYEGKFVSR